MLFECVNISREGISRVQTLAYLRYCCFDSYCGEAVKSIENKELQFYIVNKRREFFRRLLLYEKGYAKILLSLNIYLELNNSC